MITRTNALRRANPNHVNGFSVVELMVVVAIGLIMSVAIFGVLKTFEGRKRSTTSVNDINQSGNYAIYQLDKLIRSAGSSFNSSANLMYGCRLNASLNTTTILPAATLPAPFDKVPANVATPTTGSFRLAPAIIIPGAGYSGVASGGSSDVLVVMSGYGGFGEEHAYFRAPPSTTNINLPNTIGFNANDILLLGDQSSGAGVAPCYLEQINTTGPTTDQLPLGGVYYKAAGTDSYWYGSAANISAMTPQGLVVNLGNLAGTSVKQPSFQLFGLDAKNQFYSYDLLHTDGAASEAAQLIADGIFDFRAVYGVAPNSATALTWVAPTGAYSPATLLDGSATANATLQTIRAIRIGMVLRTSLPEKTNVTTTNLKMFTDLPAGVPAPNYNNSLSSTGFPSEQNYRYRIIESTIPIRNAMLN